MSRKEYWLMIALTTAAGLMGGVVSSLIFVGKPVFAQKIPQPTKVITAEGFHLMGEGKGRALLGIRPDGQSVLTFYKEEKAIWSAP